MVHVAILFSVDLKELRKKVRELDRFRKIFGEGETG
jgi:hypothetical protein